MKEGKPVRTEPGESPFHEIEETKVRDRISQQLSRH